MTEQVSLRDVRPADLEVFLAQEHDPESVRRSRFTPRPRDAFMRHWETRVLGDPENFVQAVTVDGVLAGNLAAWWDEDRRFIGYWLGQEFWGRGIGTRALGLFLEREENRPLHADPHIGNVGSVRLLERHGFRRTGAVQPHGDEFPVLVLD